MDALIQPLIQTGAVGAVLAFILTQIAPRLDKMTAAIDRNTRGNMILTMAISKTVSPLAYDKAEELIREIDHQAVT